jgi:hypothetical protein
MWAWGMQKAKAMGYEWLILGAIGVVLCYTIYCAIKSAGEVAIFRLLNEKGVMGHGSIDGFRKVDTGRPYYRIQYSYIVDQSSQKHKYSIEQSVGWGNYRRLQNSKNVTIAYLANHPQISRLAGKDTDKFDHNFQLIMTWVGFLIFPPLVIVWFILLQLNLKRWAR